MLKFIRRRNDVRLFTRTPAHRSSEAIKAEAIDKLERAATHADFREVRLMLDRIILRFEDDERNERGLRNDGPLRPNDGGGNESTNGNNQQQQQKQSNHNHNQKKGYKSAGGGGGGG